MPENRSACNYDIDYRLIDVDDSTDYILIDVDDSTSTTG